MPKRTFEELLRQAHVGSNRTPGFWWRLHGGHPRPLTGAAALTRRATQDSDGSLFTGRL